jgi:plastocyanin
MRTPLVAAVLAACALAVASCGDDDSEDAGNGAGGDGGGQAGAGGPTTLRLAADPGGSLAFDKTSLRAKPGRVVIAFENSSQVPHAVEVEGNGVEEETEIITDGSARLAVNLDAGEYKFYCPVGNHEQAGMVGTLTVR